jgi:hypothetical protein
VVTGRLSQTAPKIKHAFRTTAQQELDDAVLPRVVVQGKIAGAVTFFVYASDRTPGDGIDLLTRSKPTSTFSTTGERFALTQPSRVQAPQTIGNV